MPVTTTSCRVSLLLVLLSAGVASAAKSEPLNARAPNANPGMPVLAQAGRAALLRVCLAAFLDAFRRVFRLIRNPPSEIEYVAIDETVVRRASSGDVPSGINHWNPGRRVTARRERRDNFQQCVGGPCAVPGLLYSAMRHAEYPLSCDGEPTLV